MKKKSEDENLMEKLLNLSNKKFAPKKGEENSGTV